MNILVVEDNPLQREPYAVILAADVVTFAGGLADALKALEAGGIDGVISDLIGTGGPLTVLQIRAKFPAVPVVVLTGDKDAPPFSDPMVRVLFKGAGPGDAGPLEARAALAEMIGGG